ncbi:MAG: hypothetical protein OIF48_16030 [Silicimonas sp.]|nr:hypothetical protein [Silicimonas sp.]
MDREELDQALITAHDTGDTEALVRLYTLAGDAAERDDDIDAACFYLTHAFVFALEAGLPGARVLNQRLAAKGRAHLLDWQDEERTDHAQ